MTNVQALPEKWREPEQVAAKRPRMERIVRLQAIEWSGMRRLMRGMRRGKGSRGLRKWSGVPGLSLASTSINPEISTGPLH